MKKDKDQIRNLLQALEREFPDVQIALHYTTPLELLVATILSAQCTDERVNQVIIPLFKNYPTASDYANADLNALEVAIRPTGFYKNKARNIIACCQRLVMSYGSEVPGSMEDLVSLPGVGRKTANVVLGNCFGVPAIVVDTHVKRVSRRLGLSSYEDPERIEMDLAEILPRDRWTRTSHQILLHGRHICQARIPRCDACQLTSWCDEVDHWRQINPKDSITR